MDGILALSAWPERVAPIRSCLTINRAPIATLTLSLTTAATTRASTEMLCKFWTTQECQTHGARRGAGGNTFNANSVLAGDQFRVICSDNNGTASTFNIGNGNLNNIAGIVDYQSFGIADVFNVNDQSNAAATSYSLTTNFFTRSGFPDNSRSRPPLPALTSTAAPAPTPTTSSAPPSPARPPSTSTLAPATTPSASATQIKTASTR